MKSIIDNFSERAKIYSQFRPVYPPDLYTFIYSKLIRFETALDCGTGNGQVAVELSKKFKTVYATDISDSQLAEATQKPNIFYSNTRAEKTDFADNSFDLITVAQAYHWFDEKAFENEVKRIAKPNALLAIWGYNLLKVKPEIDEVIQYLYTNIVGDYWDDARKLVDDSYRNIHFPWAEIPSPGFQIKQDWHYEQLVGYLRSWSAVNKYQNNVGTDPIALIERKLSEVWGKNQCHTVKIPVFLRLGKMN